MLLRVGHPIGECYASCGITRQTRRVRVEGVIETADKSQSKLPSGLTSYSENPTPDDTYVFAHELPF